MKSSSAKQAIFREPHPLARELLERIQRGSRVLEIGPGSGRNFAALIARTDLTAIESDQRRAIALRAQFPDHAERILSGSYAQMPCSDRRFDAVLSSHAFLHGTPARIARSLAEVARVTKERGLFYATFGSRRDRRFGEGQQIGTNTFAPTEGDEIGVPHSYFATAELRSLLRHFTVERLEEVEVDTIAGTWAHTQMPLQGAVHWFVVARNER